MNHPVKIKQIVLASRPNGMPAPANFRFEDHELPELHTEKIRRSL